jgi:hypothetical protein
MLTKRLMTALLAFTILIPLAGCRHRCCKSEVSNFASPCCPTVVPPPPPSVLPPG